MSRKEEKVFNAMHGPAEKTEFVLSLFITGVSPNSVRALTNLKMICETHLKGRYSLEVIDIYQQPSLAREEQIVALPMLIKKFPLPERKFIGDLSDTAKVLRGLGLNDL